MSKATPRLHASKSAPGDVEAMVSSTPSQEAFNALTKAKSFQAGDGESQEERTQEMPSQIYRKYTESMLKASTTMSKGQDTFPQEEPETFREENGDMTQRTVQEGETGHIDLIGGAGWTQSSSPARSTQGYDELLDTSELQSPELEFKVPLRPVEPATPAHALAGQKHDRDGEPLTSDKSSSKQTVRFSQAFQLPTNGVMSGTQLFDQTQSRSSPVPDAPRSSPGLTRPSPNFHHTSYNAAAEASSVYGFSSPATSRTPRPSSFTANEPRDYYTTTKESQARKAQKAAIAQEQFERGRANGFGKEDDLDDTQSQLRQLRKMRRTLSDEAMTEARQLRAPMRSGSRPSSSRKARETINLVTPANRRHQGRLQHSDSVEDDLDLLGDQEQPNDEQSEEEPDEPIVHEDDENDGRDEDNDYDEYDEFGGTVLRSQANDPDEDDRRSVAESIDQEMEAEDDQQADVVEELAAHDKEETSNPTQRTQGSTIADSQPTAQQGTFEKPATQQVQHSSYVPGSQYEGKTSEEQAILASSQRQSQTRIAASQPENDSARSADKVPSSPPLQTMGLARQSSDEDAALPQEIVESDMQDAETARTREEESQGSAFAAPYSTARTHVSGSARSAAVSPAKPFASQRSSVIDPSPRKAAGVRHFADMAELARTNSSFDVNADVDAVMSGIMNDDDRMVLATASDTAEQPRSKRRRLNKEVSSNAATSEATSALPSTHAISDVEPLTEVVTADRPPEPAAEKEPSPAPNDEQPEALKDSLSKGNEMAPTSTPEDAQKVPVESPDSRRRREKAGADAVSQLISARGAKAGKKGKQVTYGRAPKRKAAKTSSAKSKRDKAEVGEVHDEEVLNEETTEAVEPPVDGAVENAALDDLPVAMDVDSAEGPNVDDGDAIPTAEAPEENDHAAPNHGNGQGAVVAPNRIMAFFRGTPPNYYPATWVGGSADGTKYKIRFDDGNVTEVNLDQVRLLDFHIGDNVKVDDLNTRTKVWRIVGFCDVGDSPEGSMDIYGHTRIKMQAKPGRKSGANAEALESEGDVREVDVAQIYLTTTLWPQFYPRTFRPAVNVKSSTAARAETPSTRSGTPQSETPSSRSRRAQMPTGKGRGRAGRTSHLREASVASSEIVPTYAPAAIFSGMAFAISYVSNESEKAEVSRLIERNGGTILQDGFEELFELPNVGEQVTSTPKKRSPKKQKDEDGGEHLAGLQLKAEHETLGFVALIADRHSRRAKYMQALALGLPTLSGRWITDCLDASKNKTLSSGEVTPLAWDRYLLPSGESSYLGGAIRSRTLAPYAAPNSRLPTTIASRTILLNGESVLIVAPKKGKTGWDKRKTYAFLTLALGAGEVKRVNDLQEAKEIVQEDPATSIWVYVDGAVAEAEKALFSKSAAGKKRKRESDAVGKEDGGKMSAADGNVRIVNDEFVVQSLILGASIE